MPTVNVKAQLGKLTSAGKAEIARAMYVRGTNFIGAAILLRRASGYEYVVLHLLCQGIEIILKSFLLFRDYDKYKTTLRTRFGHDLVKLAAECSSVFGLNQSRQAVDKELKALNNLYAKHNLRYGSFLDVLVDPKTIPSDKVFRRTAAVVRLAERHIPV